MTSTATQGTSTRLADATAQAQPSPALGGVLEALEHAPRYRDWIFAAAAPHLGNRVLEVGAGIGTLTLGLAERAGWVTAVEVDRRGTPVVGTAGRRGRVGMLGQRHDDGRQQQIEDRARVM